MTARSGANSCGHVRPSISNKDGPAINRILGKKLAASILESADLGWVHDAILAIGPIEPPLVGLRVIGTHGQTFDMAYWIIYLDRVQLGAAIPNLEADAGTFRFDPGVRACQGMQAALQVKFPCPNQGVKIMLAIAFVTRSLFNVRIFLHRVGILRLLKIAGFVRV